MRKNGNCEKQVKHIIKDSYAADGDDLKSLLERIVIKQIIKDMQE